MKEREITETVLAFIVAILLALVTYAIVGWTVSFGLAFVFGIQIGILKALMLIVLVEIFGALFFSRIARAIKEAN